MSHLESVNSFYKMPNLLLDIDYFLLMYCQTLSVLIYITTLI